MEQLAVWAEHVDGFVRVGTLAFDPADGELFTYDTDYLQSPGAGPIYPVLPTSRKVHGASRTRAAFASLGPEGAVGRDIRAAFRAGRDAVIPVLSRLNHETVGALTFTELGRMPVFGATPPTPVDEDFLAAFAHEPERVAYSTLVESRLSLNGAVAKVGVIKNGRELLVPKGLEPSTHILKAGSKAFPNQMLNEALCMRCARMCGFDDAANTELIVLDGCDPLLVSRRFDRAVVGGRPQELPSVMRLHQADFCQILGISVDALKYTPSDELIAGYNSSIARTVSQESSERYGDRSYIFELQVFNYVIGNCDNHLKNLSMTWEPDWSGKAVSPAYDITCTTMYPSLSRDMGLGLGTHRAIDKIDANDILMLADQLGIRAIQARQSLAELGESFETALMCAAHELEISYGVATTRLAESMLIEGEARRRTVLLAAR